MFKKILITSSIIIFIFLGVVFYNRREESVMESEVNFNLQPRNSLPESYQPYVAPAEKQSVKQRSKAIFIGENNKPETTLNGYVGAGDEINIIVDQPQQGAVLTSPFTIAGQARVFENTIIVQVTNSVGDVLIEETVRAHASDVGQFGQFKVTLNFSFDATKEGFVEIFSESARDGSRENLVKIPVKFK